MLENEKIWILQNILSNVEEHNSAKLLRESLFKIIDGFAPLITASGAGIYTGSITPTSAVPVSGDKVFLATIPGTYTNFGNVVLTANHFGFIFKNGNSFSIQSVEMPMQDLTPLENRTTALETKTTALENKNEGEVALSDNKNVSGSKVFNYINNKTITVYDANEFPLGYPKDARVIFGNKYFISLKNNNKTTPVNGDDWREFLNPDGNIVVGQTSKAVNGEKVEIYVQRNSVSTFKHSFADNYGYEKDSTVFIDKKFWKSLENNNKDYPSSSSEKWEQIKISADVDQEFDANSKNAISNKAVTPLADALDGFFDSGIKDESIYLSKGFENFAINGINPTYTPNGVNILRSDNTYLLYKDNYESYNWTNVPTKVSETEKITKIDTSLIRIGQSSTSNPYYVNMLGIKKNGEKVSLISFKKTATDYVENYVIDLTPYESFSLMILNNKLTNNGKNGTSIKIYKATTSSINVKEYVDKKTSVLSSFIDGSMSPIKIKELSSFDIISENQSINAVESINGHLLTGINTLKQYSESGLIFNTWHNIPTKIESDNQIVRIDLDIVRIGGSVNSNANLIGIKSDGEINVLVGSTTPTPNSSIEKLSFDLTDFVSFSLMITHSELVENTNKQKITIYKAGNDIEKDAVKTFILENGGKGGGKIERETLIHINRPTTLPVVNVIGMLPTDSTDARTPTDVEIEFVIDNATKFKCKSSLAVQGNATAQFAKKGFEAVLSNYSDEELKIQFGGWGAFSEFHLKAYPNDQTFARDLTAGKLWHQMRTSRDFPKSYIADFNAGKVTDADKENLLEQALFYTDGFPIELRVDGQFYGLYVWRIKKERDNYMINNANANHIFLDNETGINWLAFEHTNWKVRSPKLKGYEDGGEIADTALMAKLTRWWDWFKGINDGTIDFDATCEQFINVDSWVDAVITQQLTGHWDYQVNNILLTSWDGQRISVCYYDGDQTFGWVTQSIGGFQYPLTVDANGLYWRSDFWRNKLYPKLKSRIQTRYTELRNMKIIDSNNVYKTFRETTDLISRSVYEQELSAWRISQPNSGKHSLRYCMNWTNERIKKLDLIWKI